MRAASTRADQRSVGLGDLHGLRYFSDLQRSKLWLDLLNVEFFVQPGRLTFRFGTGGLVESAAELRKLPVIIDDRGSLKIDQSLASARLHVRKNKVELLVVDYLQILNAPGRDKKEKVAYCANALRAFAKSENCAVVQLSQLARPESRNVNARPTMLDLKESGDVEAHSHVIVMPYMPVNESGEMVAEAQQLIVAKNRNGGVGSVNVFFDPKHLQFAERTQYKNQVPQVRIQ